MRLLHTDRYTVREVVLGEPISNNAWEVVTESLQFIFDELRLAGHLFVTVLNTELLSRDGEEGVGHYEANSRSILIAAGDFSTLYDDGPMEEAEALGLIAGTVIHECLHYKQDLDGTLESSEANEDETEQLTDKLLEKLIGLRRERLANEDH